MIGGMKGMGGKMGGIVEGRFICDPEGCDCTDAAAFDDRDECDECDALVDARETMVAKAEWGGVITSHGPNPTTAGGMVCMTSTAMSPRAVDVCWRVEMGMPSTV